MEFVSKYSEKTKVVSTNFEPTRTKQSEGDACDINNILKRFKKTGVLNVNVKENGLYDDFSNVEDYRTSMEIILKAQEQFLNLPSNVRERFSNSPEKFLEFCSSPNSVEEMVKLGLATKTTINDEKTPVQNTQPIQTNNIGVTTGA